MSFGSDAEFQQLCNYSVHLGERRLFADIPWFVESFSQYYPDLEFVIMQREIVEYQDQIVHAQEFYTGIDCDIHFHITPDSVESFWKNSLSKMIESHPGYDRVYLYSIKSYGVGWKYRDGLKYSGTLSASIYGNFEKTT